MIDEIQRFEFFWREMTADAAALQKGRWVHPQDLPFVRPGKPGSTDELELQVPPIPANGSIRHADIVLFMLNPNFDAEKDATWRSHNSADAAVLDECMFANLHQLHASGDRAFYDVRSDLKNSPGADYWKAGGGFSEIAGALARVRGVSLDDAYDEIARRVVVLQLVPYRSKTFGHNKLVSEAPSSARAQALAHYLADHTDKLLVVQRKIKAWKFEYSSTRPNVVVYPTSLAMSASLGFNGGPGGLPIFHRLLGRTADVAPSGAKRLALRSLGSAVPNIASPRVELFLQGAPQPDAQIGGPPPGGSVLPQEKSSPDRTDELRSIYSASGLDRLLTSRGVSPPGKEAFSKLKFLMPNDFRVASIELYDLKNGERYFRVHYAKDRPQWLFDELAKWDMLRKGSRSSGSNFTITSANGSLEYARALAQLLQRHA